MGRKTEPARIVNYINKSLPKRVKVIDFFDNIRTRLEEIITFNLDHGANPITFYSIQQIFAYYREVAIASLSRQVPTPEAEKIVDDIVQRELNELFNKYYK
ncbi:hypothetical protein SFV1gp54 [Sulfolobus filamentous virus 1]|uniref:Uncharacterized protein n=2 Tax=Alphalipothrixvirus beppuense TaxID=2734584 RepID=A0A346LU93_SUFV1|nr:hypothetical protein HOT91_gp54 [Sulfolobus filamentous virus 1]AXQ00136.1 hypothetical protein SFV1gp54 [Sulfolobus filamentous virus 1]AZI75756.1 hypothetical protein SBFV1_gp55 [Sulfolobales Beppu filamentous phage 1]